MQFVLLTLLSSFYLIHDAVAQTGSINDIVIHFNLTGINYPEDILFFLYTRETGEKHQKLLVNDEESLEQSLYSTSRPTKFLTHGWTSSGTESSCVLPRRGFLRHGDYNVIVVDWSAFSKTSYPMAASRVKAVGQYTSKMVEFLVREGSDIKQMSLVGHSLGAHIMGLAGHELSPKVGHIVGLDPARPGFEMNTAAARIDSSDADRVEIIHTNAGTLGFSYPVGHVDYWPNGGARQPGCGIDQNGSCAHGRAYMYFAESLENPDSWFGIQCSLYSQFVTGWCGNNRVDAFPRWDPVPNDPKGNYMLRTKESSLFGLGRSGTQPNGYF